MARLEGQSAWARIYPIEMYMIKLGIGFTQETEETTEVVSIPMLVYINLLAFLHVLHAWTVLCGSGFYSLSNGFYSLSNVESNKSKCCPALPGAWVPATMRGPCIGNILVSTLIGRLDLLCAIHGC